MSQRAKIVSMEVQTRIEPDSLDVYVDVFADEDVLPFFRAISNEHAWRPVFWCSHNQGATILCPGFVSSSRFISATGRARNLVRHVQDVEVLVAKFNDAPSNENEETTNGAITEAAGVSA